jgi:PAS domain S-box-containing protein
MSTRGNLYTFPENETPDPATGPRIHGCGEMANLVRSRDWTPTQLGAVENWPEPLVCAVNTVLESRIPMAIYWGPEMIQIYNDAFLALIGEWHPQALGAPAAETWRSVWPVIGPRFQAALHYGQATAPEDVPIPTMREGRLEEVYWTYSTIPIHGPPGEAAGLLAVFLDATGERLARRDRRLIAEQLNQVLDVTTDGVVSLDRDYRFTYLNRRAREILAPRENVLGRSIWECFPRMAREDAPYAKKFRRAMEDAKPGAFEAYYPEPLNISVQVNVQPAKDGIVIFFRDVTAQRQTETDAEESAARLEAIYNTSLEYIGLLTRDGRVLDCNRASLEFAGNTREELLGCNFWECPWWTYTPGAPEMIRHAIARAALGEPVRCEVRLARPQGDPITFDFSLTPARNPRGDVVFLVPEARDITWVKRAELALKETEKLAAVGRLAASIAHEINNPLEAVTNLLYLASRSGNMDELHDYLHMAERELRRASSISSETLRFNRQSAKPRIVDCDELIESALFIHHGRIVNARIQVEQRLASHHPLNCFDGEIRQVLNNLVANAIDAMQGTGGRLLVRSRQATHWPTGRKGLLLTVADSGAGIRAENRRKIFEPFFTTKGSSGTGLGLWVSQEIAQRHQGQLRVRSSQGRTKNGTRASGTVFTLFLPFDAALRQSAA